MYGITSLVIIRRFYCFLSLLILYVPEKSWCNAQPRKTLRYVRWRQYLYLKKRLEQTRKPLYQDVNVHYCTRVYMILKCYSEWKPHLGWLKILSNHSGNRTYDLTNASHALYQLSYVVRTVRYCDISELDLGNIVAETYYVSTYVSVCCVYLRCTASLIVVFCSSSQCLRYFCGHSRSLPPSEHDAVRHWSGQNVGRI